MDQVGQMYSIFKYCKRYGGGAGSKQLLYLLEEKSGPGQMVAATESWNGSAWTSLIHLIQQDIFSRFGNTNSSISYLVENTPAGQVQQNLGMEQVGQQLIL
jgi:hypothetical protein